MMHKELKIKVCGMRDTENVSEVATLRPDYMGFIFYPPSPRFCSDLNPELIRGITPGIIPVAVVVDMDETGIMSLVGKYGFKAVQLHGCESPELCRKLRDRGLSVIKAISVKDGGYILNIGEYEEAVDLFVFDTATSNKGGSGKKFDWKLLENADIKTDFLLSGGIGPEDKEPIYAFRHPHFLGIDLNSRFEISPGIKDVALLKQFMNIK